MAPRKSFARVAGTLRRVKDDGGRSRAPSPRLWGRVGAVTAIGAFVVFWAWIFLTFAGSDNPDRLEDRAFPTAAQGRCEATEKFLGTIEFAGNVDSPVSRSVLVADATIALEAMVQDLRTLAPKTSAEGIVERWLADWDRYLSDRLRYVSVLESGKDEPFSESLDGVVRPTERINGFANVNEMDSCKVPSDV